VSSVCSLPDTGAKELLIEEFKVLKTAGPHSQLCNCSLTHALKAHNAISPLAHILQYHH